MRLEWRDRRGTADKAWGRVKCFEGLLLEQCARMSCGRCLDLGVMTRDG
jgi:hypothetical protein